MPSTCTLLQVPFLIVMVTVWRAKVLIDRLWQLHKNHVRKMHTRLAHHQDAIMNFERVTRGKKVLYVSSFDSSLWLLTFDSARTLSLSLPQSLSFFVFVFVYLSLSLSLCVSISVSLSLPTPALSAPLDGCTTHLLSPFSNVSFSCLC